MTDWAVQNQGYNRVIISASSPESIGTEKNVNLASSAPANTAWPTANKAFYIPFVVYQTTVILKMFCGIGTASGNIDAGIYDDQKNRLVSIGGTAQVGASAIQTFDITDTTLNPGVYYMALAADNATGTVLNDSVTNLVWAGAAGVLMQTSAYPLPDPANWVATVNGYTPMIGLLARLTV